MKILVIGSNQLSQSIINAIYRSHPDVTIVNIKSSDQITPAIQYKSIIILTGLTDNVVNDLHRLSSIRLNPKALIINTCKNQQDTLSTAEPLIKRGIHVLCGHPLLTKQHSISYLLVNNDADLNDIQILKQLFKKDQPRLKLVSPQINDDLSDLIDSLPSIISLNLNQTIKHDIQPNLKANTKDDQQDLALQKFIQSNPKIIIKQINQFKHRLNAFRRAINNHDTKALQKTISETNQNYKYLTQNDYNDSKNEAPKEQPTNNPDHWLNHFTKHVPANQIYNFSQRIKNIPHLIKLTIGEPDVPTPGHIKKAAIQAIEHNHSHYTNAKGILPLRQNAAKYLKNKYGLNYDPKTQIIVTTGVTEGLQATFGAILEAGDEVAIPTPTFPVYTTDVLQQHAKPVYINTADNHFILSAHKLDTVLKSHPQIKVLVLNYPNNPVGNTYSSSQLEALARVIKKHHILCICDEIYSELTYEHPHVLLGTILPNQTIILNGVSKAFAMTGWRIGLVCGPAVLIKGINNIHVNNIVSATECAQYAANEAFKHGYHDGPRMRDIYRKRQIILRRGLLQAGFTCPKPTGAFYIFAKIPKYFHQTSVQFAYRLAKQAHVGVIPGSIFGPGGEGYLRISYANTRDRKSVV